MKVRMKVDVSGTRDGQPWPQRGSVVDLPDAEAAEYCANGMADPIAVFNEPEKAVTDESVVEQRLTTRTGPTKRSAR